MPNLLWCKELFQLQLLPLLPKLMQSIAKWETPSPIKCPKMSPKGLHLLHQYVCLKLIGNPSRDSPVAFVLDVHHLDFAVPAKRWLFFLGSALRPATTVTVQHEVIHVEAAEGWSGIHQISASLITQWNLLRCFESLWCYVHIFLNHCKIMSTQIVKGCLVIVRSCLRCCHSSCSNCSDSSISESLLSSRCQCLCFVKLMRT